MKPGPRALYVELKRRFNGSNNGAIYLSHRDAAVALNVHRNTVGPMFRELERRGPARNLGIPDRYSASLRASSMAAMTASRSELT